MVSARGSLKAPLKSNQFCGFSVGSPSKSGAERGAGFCKVAVDQRFSKVFRWPSLAAYSGF